MDTNWISIDEAAAILGIGRMPANVLARTGQLPARKSERPAANGSFPWELERAAVEERAARMAIVVPTEAECGIDWMPFQEAADLLEVSRNALYERIEKGYLQSAKFGNPLLQSHFVNRKEIMEHLQQAPHAPKAEFIWTPPALSEKDRGWFGGILDGEGCISIIRATRRNGFQWYPGIGVANTNPLPIEWAKECFGGNTALRPRQNPRHKDAHVWQVSNARAAAVLRYLRDCIHMKAAQADLAISFQEHLDSRAYRIVPADVIAYRNEQFARMHELNRKGARQFP